MRKAAGIILLVLVVFGLATTIIYVRALMDSGIPSSTLVYMRIVSGGFLIAAGVLCLKGKYWGLCLATGLFSLLVWINSVLTRLVQGDFWTNWQTWVWGVGALVSTIFISLTKREWQENQGLPDSSTNKRRRGMRIAAGIILIVSAVAGLVALVIDVKALIDLHIPSLASVSTLFPMIYSQIVWDGFFVAAGVLCLKRRYWGLCLGWALFALLVQISVVGPPLLRGHFSTSWQTWIWVIGALISTIFISLTKREWQEQGLPDSSTSQHLPAEA